jgi:hypothetical protein
LSLLLMLLWFLVVVMVVKLIVGIGSYRCK